MRKTRLIVLSLGLVFGVLSCGKDKIATPEVRVFENAITLGYTKVSVSAEVTDQGGAEVKSRGIAYGKSGGKQDTVFCGSGTGVFSAELTSLEPNTVYTYEAFARNVGGFGVSGKVTFSTKDYSLPTVNTLEAENIGMASVTLGGEVTKDGDANVTERGVCWNTSQHPTLDDNHAAAGDGIGSFTCDIANLTANTTYYVRAYAINSKGTAYGDEVSFTTLDYALPEVSTSDVTGITQTVATGGGEVTNDGGSAVTERGICWSQHPSPTMSDSHMNQGSGTGAFSCEMTGLTPHTTYYVRAYAVNVKGIRYGQEKTFNTSADLPTVTTGAVSNISFSSASGNGHVVDDGGSPVTERGVCWSTNHTPTIAGPHESSGEGTGSFMVSLTGLSPNTTYYVKAYAINGVGVSYGEEVEFKTLTENIPEVTTTSVTNIGQTTATGGGNVVSDGGASVTERGVCWGTSHNPTINGSHGNQGTGLGSFTMNIMDLTPNSTYYVRAYAVNSQGIAYGNEVEFHTLSVTVPVVTVAAVTNIGQTSAAGGGEVVSDGGAQVTERGVCWGTSHNPTINGSHANHGTGTGAFTVNMTGLAPNTKYYVRAYAVNVMGVSYSEGEVDFNTPGINTPTVTTKDVVSITQTSAASGGNVTDDGGAEVTARGVCWSTSQNPTISSTHTSNGTGTGNFTSNMLDLVQGTKYYVRAYATNSAGTGYGEQKEFTTQSIVKPTVTTNEVTNITQYSAKCGGNVTNNGGGPLSARGVCWSTSPNPTINDSHTNNGTGTGSFASNITGLTPGTTYYVKAYATNAAGTAYGARRTFTTTGGGSWLYYGDFNNHLNCWGLTNGGTDEWAVMFPTSLLSQYAGTSITKVDAYLGETGSYTLKIYRGGTSQPTTLLRSQSFNVTNTGWNTITISPLTLNTNYTLWVSISATYNAGQYPKGACNGINNPNARWVNPNGNGWVDVYNNNGNVDICWEIHAFVTQTKSENDVEIQLPQYEVNPKPFKDVQESRNPNEGIAKYKQ